MFISFGYLTKKSLIFLVLPVIMVIRYYLTEKTLKNITNMFYPCFVKFLCCSINGIVLLAVKITTISKKKEIKDNKDKILLILDKDIPIENNQERLLVDEQKKENNKYTNIYSLYESSYYEKIKFEKQNKRKKICFLILVCILDFISVSYQTIMGKTIYFKESSKGLTTLTSASRLFAIAILSHLIIKNTKMYSHHYLSAIIIFIVLIAIIIFSLFTETKYKENYFSKFGLMILQELLFSSMYVCGEKYLSISEGNINKFLFIDGIIGMILSILFQIVSNYFITCSSINQFFDKSLENYCDSDHLKTILENLSFKKFGGVVAILNILALFFDIWLLWLVILKFSAIHFGAIYPIPLFYRWFSKGNIENSIVYIFGNIIIFLMTLVYNEIIILKFCGFEKNTSIEINKRSVEELNYAFDSNENESSENSDGSSTLMLQNVSERISYASK